MTQEQLTIPDDIIVMGIGDPIDQARHYSVT